jgi:hypothetical protein
MGTMTLVDIHKSHLSMRTPLRRLDAEWADVDLVDFDHVRIAVLGTGGQRFVSALYPTNPIQAFVAAHTRLFSGRQQMKVAVSAVLDRHAGDESNRAKSWKVNWTRPSNRFLLLIAAASILTELLVLLTHR